MVRYGLDARVGVNLRSRIGIKDAQHPPEMRNSTLGASIPRKRALEEAYTAGMRHGECSVTWTGVIQLAPRSLELRKGGSCYGLKSRLAVPVEKGREIGMK